MRRAVIVTVGIVVVLGVVAAAAFYTTVGQNALFRQAAKAAMSRDVEAIDGMRVVVCGSASPLGNDPDRAQACIAVMTPEHFFLFDVGAGSPARIAQARLPMDRLNGVFLTHFHSDHIAGLPDVNLASWVQGRKQPLSVLGPDGVATVVEGLNLAYSLDRGYRTAHHGPFLLPPDAGPMQAVTITPGDVAWRDDLMTITSVAVDHAPISPAVGYRVDYRGRSVVISGDTNASDALFALAKNADLLLHDALSRALLDPMIAVASEVNLPVLPRIMTDVIDYHADSLSLEAGAAEAGVRQLAYYHLVPVPTNALTRAMFARGLAPTTLLVHDLQTFDLPVDSTEIFVH